MNKFYFPNKMLKIPKYMSPVRLNVFEKSRNFLLDLHDEYCGNSSNLRNLVFIDFVEDFVIQRQDIFQFIVRYPRL